MTIQEERITVENVLVGWLLHDNKFFNMTCPTDGGMFSSYETKTCPKCGMALVPITAGGKNMSVSEGTIKPCLSDFTRKRYAETLKTVKNSMPITYRFKMFSFSNNPSTFTKHPAHDLCRKGAYVKIVMRNHPIIAKWFTTKDGTVSVELLHMLYDNYGDSITVLKAPEIAKTTTMFDKENDKPVTINAPYPNAPTPEEIAESFGEKTTSPGDQLAAMAKRMNELQAQLNQLTASKNSATQTQSAQTSAVVPENGDILVDPF